MNSPAEVISYVEQLSQRKSALSLPKLFLLSLLGGMYIALGGALSQYVSAAVSPHLGDGIAKLLAGALFPIGLILIVMVGGELFTGNVAYMVVGVQQRRVRMGDLLRNWLIVWCANFLGALLLAVLFCHVTGLFADPVRHDAIVAIGFKKVGLTPIAAITKGVAANWLVCLALWLGYSARSMGGRVLGVWIPVMAFVTMGYEHSIANMFYIPMAMLSGAGISIGEMLLQNLLPVTLGNIIGGGLFVGSIYAYLYGQPQTK